MGATPSNWRVKLQPGDTLSVNATYDSERADWYEVMGIMPVAVYDGGDAGGVGPFSDAIPQNGVLTHGHLRENRHHGGEATDLPDPRLLPGAPTPLDPIDIEDYVYEQGDLHRSGTGANPPKIQAGESLTFLNQDAEPERERVPHDHRVQGPMQPRYWALPIRSPTGRRPSTRASSGSTTTASTRRPWVATRGRPRRTCLRATTATSAASIRSCGEASAWSEAGKGGEGMRRLLTISAIGALLVVPTVAFGAATEIKVTDDTFAPKTPAVRTVQAGASYHWVRAATSDGEHNIRQDVRLFRSGDATEGPIDYTRSASAGSFHYYCELHGSASGGMAGVLKVRPALNQNPTGLPFTVIWANSGTNTGKAFDVRYKVGTGVFKTWKNDVAGFQGVFGQGGSPVVRAAQQDVPVPGPLGERLGSLQDQRLVAVADRQHLAVLTAAALARACRRTIQLTPAASSARAAAGEQATIRPRPPRF